MFSRPMRLLLLAIVAVASSSSSLTEAAVENMAPNVAAFTVLAENRIYIVDTLIDNNKDKLPGIAETFAPVKAAIRKGIKDGKVTHDNVLAPLEAFLKASDPEFAQAAYEAAKKNSVNLHDMSKLVPEASWDFRYYCTRKAAKLVNNPVINKKLEALNEELEGDFQKKTSIDGIVAKIDKFNTEAEAAYKGFADQVFLSIENEIGTYNEDKLPTTPFPPLDTGKGKTADKDVAASAASSDVGSQQNGTEPATTATPSETSEETGSSSGGGVIESPVATTTPATTAPVAEKKTPAPSKSSAVSSSLAAAAVGIATTVAALSL